MTISQLKEKLGKIIDDSIIAVQKDLEELQCGKCLKCKDVTLCLATTTALAKSTFAKKIVEFVTKEDLSGLTLKDMVEFDKWLKIKILEHTRLTSKDFKIKMN